MMTKHLSCTNVSKVVGIASLVQAKSALDIYVSHIITSHLPYVFLNHSNIMIDHIGNSHIVFKQVTSIMMVILGHVSIVTIVASQMTSENSKRTELLSAFKFGLLGDLLLT